jgi:DNA-binding MarR family transcriptional regulator
MGKRGAAHFDSDEPSWEMFHSVYLNMRGAIQGSIKQHGLLLSEYHTLALCDRAKDPLTLSLIAQSLGVTPAAITDLVRRLAKRGLIRLAPNPADHRSSVVTLTPSGRALVLQARSARRKAIHEIVLLISPEGRQGLLRGLSELRNATNSRQEA